MPLLHQRNVWVTLRSAQMSVREGQMFVSDGALGELLTLIASYLEQLSTQSTEDLANGPRGLGLYRNEPLPAL